MLKVSYKIVQKCKAFKSNNLQNSSKVLSNGICIGQKKPPKRCALGKYKIDIGAHWDTCLWALLHVGCQEVHAAGLLFTLWPHRA